MHAEARVFAQPSAMLTGELLFVSRPSDDFSPLGFSLFMT